MKILMTEAANKQILTKMEVTAHYIATYEEVGEKDYPQFEFGEFEYEKHKTDVAKEMNSWDIELNGDADDNPNFKSVEVNDAYFSDEEDGDTGIIEILIDVYTEHPLTDEDKQYIAEAAAEYMEEDANVNVKGTWVGEEEYWDGYSYEPSYRDARGELDEAARIKLDNSQPITYKTLS